MAVAMLTSFNIVCLLLTLAASVRSVPAPEAASSAHLAARRLLGSSFGVPVPATFDYVVVGGGNGGLTLAARLAEDPSNLVALVEAGSFYEMGNGNLSQIPGTDVFFAGKDPTDTNPMVDWGFVTTPQAGANGASSHYTRGKCLGGNTARNYMTYQVSTKAAYKMWADAVDDDSYTYEKFLPYFEKHMKFTPPNSNLRFANATPDYDPATLGKSGPVSVSFPNYAGAFGTWAMKAMKEIGMNPIKGFTSGQLIGSSYALSTIDATLQTRETSETAYLRPAIKNKPNLIVYQSTLAKKILFDSTKAATGVQVDSAGAVYTLSAKKEVVVSAGSFQSPQLLMVSGVGPAATLQKYGIPVIADRPGVGQNMQDHILFGPAYRVNVITGSAVGNPAFFQNSVKQFNSNPPTGILTNPGDDVIGWEKIPNSLRANFSATAKSDLSKFPADWPEVEYLNVGGFFGYQQNFVRDAPRDAYNYATVATALITPLSRGSISISSANTADPPIIDPNWLTHPTDVEVAIAAFKRSRQLFQTNAMKPILIGPEYFPGADVQTDAQILAWIRKAFNTVFHASSTCSMGKVSDPKAVLDSKARVIGVSKLRVVDASSFPFLVPGHPMSTIYALAEKIADDMKKGN